MANIYVRSTDGSDSDNGSTWALAKATATGAAAIDAAGDTIYLSQSHSESTASSVTLSFAGTNSNPTKLICGNDGAEPPTSADTTAIIATGTGASNITVNGSLLAYGVTFKCGVGSSNNVITTLGNTSGDAQYYEDCVFEFGTSAGTTTRLQFGPGSTALAASKIDLQDCTVKFSNTGQFVCPESAVTRWKGGGVLAGGSAITTFIKPVDTTGRTGNCIMSGLDLSAGASSMNLVDVGALTGRARIVFDSCKLPASWSGSLTTGTLSSAAVRVEMYNCDSGDTNYKLSIVSYAGNILQETTLVKSGGASDGTTTISWKLVTTANANESVAPLVSGDMAIWNDTVGSSKTITVDVLHDSATALTDSEVWLEVLYLGTSGFPLGTVATDKRATPLTSASNQSSSSASWTTTGMSNPNKQKIDVTFTPQEKGWAICRAHLAKASYTLYVDPQPVIS